MGKNRPATLEGGGSKAPSAPDPGISAEAQYDWGTRAAAYNKALNLGNYQNPFGGQTSYISSYDPATGAPIYSTNVNVNPYLQNSINSILGSLPNTGVQNAQNEAAINNLVNQSQYFTNQTGYPMQQMAQQQANILGLTPSAQNYIAQQNQLYNLTSGLAPQYQNLQGQYANLSKQLNQGQALDAQRQGQQAAYAAQTQYLDPRFAQQQESTEAKLAAQGLAPGSQAYQNAMQQFNAQKQQAYSDAANQAVMTGSQLGAQNLQNQLAGIQAQSGLLGAQQGVLGNIGNVYGQMGQSNAQNMGFLGQLGGMYGDVANLAGQQMGALQGANQMLGMQAGLLQQRQQTQQMPYAQLQSLAGFIPGMQGIGGANVSAPDYAGLLNNQYQSQLGQYNASQQSRNQMLGGLGTAAILGFMSDRRLKKNIKRIGNWDGTPVYSYEYIFGGPRQIGVMAQEAPAHAVSSACGVLMVNYSKLF